MIAFEDLEDVLDDLKRHRFREAEFKVGIMLEEERKVMK